MPEPPLVLGWEEWVALPELGLPAIKAKIDTGARTSALHAESIETWDAADGRRARFVIRPVPRRPDIVVACDAPLVDMRIVTSSNGMQEQRTIIATTLAIAGRTWPIEVSLSDRRDMSFRMLLGRQALQAGRLLIDPDAAFSQPRLGFKLYPGYARKKPPRRKA